MYPVYSLLHVITNIVQYVQYGVIQDFCICIAIECHILSCITQFVYYVSLLYLILM